MCKWILPFLTPLLIFLLFIICTLLHQPLLQIPPITNPKQFQPNNQSLLQDYQQLATEEVMPATTKGVLMTRNNCTPTLAMALDSRKKRSNTPTPALPSLPFKLSSLWWEKERNVGNQAPPWPASRDLVTMGPSSNFTSAQRDQAKK